MKGFKFEPVRWAAWLIAVLVAVIGANDKFDVLPVGVTPYLNYAAAVLVLLLGGAVRARVTALASPHDSSGAALVPLTMTTPPTGGAPAPRPRGWDS
jgi:hypothetical protein